MTAVAWAARGGVGRTASAFLHDIIRPPAWLAYVLRVSVATVVTLYLAFWFELPTPYSAVTTVFIVANPIRGAIVSKSFWRLAGTLIGAIAAIGQFAVFGQSPLLFFAFIALWVGLCCGASTLLRFFPSYGTVLAGYTVVIIDVGALASPERSFGVALARLSVVTLGIVVTGLVFLLSQRASPIATFEGEIAKSAVAIARLIRSVLEGEPVESLRPKRRALAAQITGHEQAIVYASADDLDVRERARRLRVAVSDLLAALADGIQAATSIRDLPAGGGDARYASAKRLLAEALEAIDGPSGRLSEDAGLLLRRADLELGRLREQCEDLDTLAGVELARLMIERFENVVADLDGVAGRADGPDVRLRPFLDFSNAGRNAVRGFLAVAIASMFWYLTQWPSGPTLLAYMVPAAALLSTNPSPGAAAARFVQGTVIAVIMAVICQAAVLPHMTNFVPAVLVLLVFTAPGMALQLSPTWGTAAFSYLVFFNTNLGLENAMTFDLPTLLANVEATLLGCLALLLTFRILLPPDPALAVRQLARALGNEGQFLARAVRLPDPRIWENLQLQRILQIGQRLDAMRSPRRGPVVEAAASGMILGRLVMRLRDALLDERLTPSDRQNTEAALAALGSLRREPVVCADRLHRAAQSALADGGEGRLRLAALLQIASRVIAANAAFFDRSSGLDVASDAAVKH